MNRKKLLAPILAGAMMLGLLAPMPTDAATNTVAEIPVNFTNTTWEDEDANASKSEIYLWGELESSYTDSYTINYKLYVPQSIMKEDSVIQLWTRISFQNTEQEYAGYAYGPYVELHHDGSMTGWDEEKKEDIPIDFASAKKSNDYWVVSYKAKSEGLKLGNATADASKAESVYVSFDLIVKGIQITSDKAVYLDDVEVVSEDGTTVYYQDFKYFENLESVGRVWVAPNLGSDDGKAPKAVTLANPTAKTLKVAKTSLTVKVGKKVTIKATAKPKAKITYKSSNKKIATVTSKGVVTGKKAGKAVITVKGNGKTVKVKVTVKGKK